MSLTSKSPRKVIAAALVVGRATLRDYAHPNSPKVFTQPQLFACLALMVFFNTDYRGIEALLADLPGLREWIGLSSRVPDHSTLHKAAKRFFGSACSQKLLTSSLRLALGRRRLVTLAAGDSTGLESGHRSAYFIKRKARGQNPRPTESTKNPRQSSGNPLYQTAVYTRYPKLSLLIDCASHVILSVLTSRGPKPDINELAPLLQRLPRGVSLGKIALDAGYDSEPNHQLCRDEHGIASLIPPTHGRPCKPGKLPTGRWRRIMTHQFKTPARRRQSGYTQRWQVETVNSMIKRNLGEELMSRSYQAQNREMRWMAIVHNIMIVLWERFSTEHTHPLFFPCSQTQLSSERKTNRWVSRSTALPILPRTRPTYYSCRRSDCLPR
jgi:IS5 family transposase